MACRAASRVSFSVSIRPAGTNIAGRTFSVRRFTIRLVSGRTGLATLCVLGVRRCIDAGHLSVQPVQIVLARIEQIDDDSRRFEDPETARQIRKHVLQIVVDVTD